MLHIVRTFLRYIALVFLALLAASFLANNIVAPLIGAESESTVPLAATRILMHLLVILLDAALRSRNSDAQRAYVGALGHRPYDRAADLRGVLRSPATRIDAALYALVMLGLAAVAKPASLRWLFLAGIPLFAVTNVAVTVRLHGRWAAGRMAKDERAG